ncbi:L,D-transpeptidase [Actinoplanes sp. NPDC051494]|uniref:L,D-transpeptidase n=1 Tax=Actinoplanes sp. NPDC051494 TaxID=3363907 RepID=UPI0037A3E66E
MRKKLTAGLMLVAVMLGLGAAPSVAALPSYHPSKLAHVGSSRQVIVVTGTGRGTTRATLRAYEKNANGSWSLKMSTPARNGYAGWAWANKRVQDTGTSPIGTFRITTTFGLKANPGTKLRYTRVDGNDWWAGDARDPKTYNLFQKRGPSTRTWRKSQSERLASYPTQYQYAAVINFNRPPASTVTWDAKRGQFVTSKPANVKRGSAIFLHVNGSGSTAGCVSVSRTAMVKILTWLDPAKTPRIVMAPLADIRKA